MTERQEIHELMLAILENPSLIQDAAAIFKMATDMVELQNKREENLETLMPATHSESFYEALKDAKPGEICRITSNEEKEAVQGWLNRPRPSTAGAGLGPISREKTG